MAEAFLSRVLRPMVSRALKRALGGVFDLEKASELEFAALKGVIALSDVKIHPGLAIPGLDLVEGQVGRLELKIPWQRLGSEAVQVHVSDVSIVFRLSTVDEGVGDVVKRHRLRAAEIVARAEDAEDEAVEEEGASADTASSGGDTEKRRRWIDRVLENMAFTAEKLKIRILSRKGLAHEVALFMTVDSISLETTDAEGRPAYVMRQNELIPLNRKCLIRGFSMQISESASSVVGATVLEPMWVSCIIEDRSRERRIMDCRLGPVRVRMGPSHLKSLISFSTSRTSGESRTQVLLKAPTSPRILLSQKRNLKACVLWAYHLTSQRQRKSKNKLGWIQYVQRVRDRSAYVRLYVRRLMELDAIAGGSKKEIQRAKLSESDTRDLDRLEKKLPFSVVLLFRSYAEAELAYASNTSATSSTISSSAVAQPPEKKKSSRFAVVSKIRGKLRRKKSSTPDLVIPHLTPGERQRLYEEVMSSAEDFPIVGQTPSDGGRSGPEMEDFGSSLVSLRALSFELTLLNAGGSDSSFLRLRAKELSLDASFFVDSKPTFEFSVGKMESVDEMTESKVLTFSSDGYPLTDRARRLSTGSVDTGGINPSPGNVVTRKSVKTRSSFLSRHLIEWKDSTANATSGRPQELEDFTLNKAKIVGKWGGTVKVAPLHLNLTFRLLRNLQDFVPSSSSQSAGSSTQWIFECPKVSIVSETKETQSVLMALDAEMAEWRGTAGMFTRCGVAFGQANPHCLPLDVLVLGKEIEIALSNKEAISESARSGKNDERTRIRLELTSDIIVSILKESRQLRSKGSKSSSSSSSSSSSTGVVAKILSSIEFAIVDLEAEIRINDAQTDKNNRFSCSSFEISRVVPKRQCLVNLQKGLSIKFEKSGEVIVEGLEDQEGLHAFWWDAAIGSGLVNIVRSGFSLPSSGKEATSSSSLKSTLSVKMATPTSLVFPLVDSSGKFCKVFLQGGFTFNADGSGELRVFGPIQADSFWLFKDGNSSKAPNDDDGNHHYHLNGELDDSAIDRMLFFTCEKDLIISFVESSRKMVVKAAGVVEYQHHQTLALELNDYFQTQILPSILPSIPKEKPKGSTQGGAKSMSFCISCPHGYRMTLLPAPLPKDVTVYMDRVQLNSKTLEITSFPKSLEGKELVTIVLDPIEVFRVPGAEAESSTEVDSVTRSTDPPLKLKIDWERWDLTEEQESSIVLNPLMMGVRKMLTSSTQARKRRNCFSVHVLRSNVLEKNDDSPIVLAMSRQLTRLVSIILSENIQDFRRAKRSPNDEEAKSTAPKWVQVLPNEPVSFPRVQDRVYSEQYVFRELSLHVNCPLKVELKLDARDSAQCVTMTALEGLSYASREVRSIEDPSISIRPSAFALKGKIHIGCSIDDRVSMEVSEFELSRCSTGANRDELHEVRLGPIDSQSVEDLAVFISLLSFITRLDEERERMFHRGVDFRTDRWAKHFRILPVTWNSLETNTKLVAQGSMLQSRKRKETPFTIQCLIEHPLVLEAPMTFRIDGMHSGMVRQYSVLCDPLRARSTLALLSSLNKSLQSAMNRIKVQWNQLKEGRYSFEQGSEDGNGDAGGSKVKQGPSPKPPRPDMIVVVALRGFQLTVLTANHKPCIRAYASKTISRAHFKSSMPDKLVNFTFFDEDGVSGLGLGVSYFNQSIIKWEPLLEQALFHAEFKWNTGFNSYGVTLESTDPVRLNATVAGVEALKRLSSSSLGSSSSTVVIGEGTNGSMAAAMYSEWVFENDSGESVVLTLEYDNAPPPQTIGNGERFPLKDFDTKESKLATITFGDDYHPLRSVPLGAVGYFVFPLYPKFTQQRHSRLIQVSLSIFVSEGSMVVRVCSSVAIENLTNVPLEVLLMPTPQEEGGEELTGRSALLGPLLPEKTLSLPIQSLTTRLSIRPFSTALTFSWWTGMSVFTLEPGSMQGSCEAAAPTKEDPKKKETFAFHVCIVDASTITGMKSSSSRTTKRDGRFQIVFLPALTVINALPVELNYRFSGQTERFPLKPGQKGVSHSPGSRILFRLSNSAWSETVSIVPGATQEPPHILLEDSSGKHLKLLLDIKTGMGGSPRVTVYAKAWFLNRSGLPLAYRVGDTGLRLFDTRSGQSSTTGGAMISSSSKQKALEDTDNHLIEIKIGSACEFLVGSEWKQVVVVGLREPDASFDVILTDSNIKVGGVKPSQLRKRHTGGSHKSFGLLSVSNEITEDSLQEDQGNEYVLFSESSGSLQVKVDSSTKGSMWSPPFAIDNVGTDGVLQLKRETYPPSLLVGLGALNVLGPNYVLGVHVGSSSFPNLRVTPIVTLVPRHLVVNRLGEEWGLVLCNDTDDGNRMTMTDERMALHCTSGKVRIGLERLLDFGNRTEHPTLTRSGFKLSGVIDISKPCQESVKLHNKRSGEVIVLKIKVDWLDSHSPTLVCTVSKAVNPSEAVYWITNETRSSIVHYYQILPETTTTAASSKGVVERVFPGEGREFGWDVVEGDQRIIELDFGGKSSLLRIRPDDLSAHPFKMNKFVVRTFVQGVTKVIAIAEEELVVGWKEVTDPEEEDAWRASDDDEQSTIVDEGEQGRGVQDAMMVEGEFVASLKDQKEENDDKKHDGEEKILPMTTSSDARTYHLQLRFSFVSVSFVDSFPQEIAALHVSDVDLSVFRRHNTLESQEEFSIAASAKYVQLDNCTLNARLPVLMWPAATRQTFLSAVVSGRITPDLVMISKLQVSMAPFDLFLEERVLLLIIRMFKECKQILSSSSVTIKKTNKLEDDDGGVVNTSTNSVSEETQKPIEDEGDALDQTSFLSKIVFMEKAKIDAMSFTVTIQRLVEEDPVTVLSFPRWRGPGTSSESTSTSSLDDPSSASAAPSVESVLASFPSAFTDVDRANVSLPPFESRRVFSTVRQVLHQTKRRYSQDLLSNVYRILSTELMRVVSPIGGGLRVEDAGSGLLHGAYGALDAASKVSGAIGSGAAFLSMDPKFVSLRRQALIDERPDGLGTGVVLGAKAIGTGILMGITGVVTQPIYGASEGGVAGFVAGVGKGIVGVGVKPVVGVFDMVASVFAGARSATAWLDPSETPRRARMPRLIGGEARALQPFDPRAALVQELLVKLWGVDRWRNSVQGDATLEYRLLEADSLVLVRVDTLLVCVDYGSYSQLLQADRVDIGSFNAARPVLAWEIDGRAVESFEIDEADEQTLVVNLQYLNKSGVISGSGKLGGIVQWKDGKWVMRLPTQSDEALGYLCRALQRIVLSASSSSSSPSAASTLTTAQTGSGRSLIQSTSSHFGLSTTVSDQRRCVVSGVQPGSLAEKSGFEQGDVVLGFFGRPLSGRDAEGARLHEAVAFMLKESNGAVMDVSVERAGVVNKIAIQFNSIEEPRTVGIVQEQAE